MYCFSVGDGVFSLVDQNDGNDFINCGLTGVVCYINGERVGVRWDFEECHGHSCSGRCENGYGWYVDRDTLGLLPAEDDEDNLEFQSNFLNIVGVGGEHDAQV